MSRPARDLGRCFSIRNDPIPNAVKWLTPSKVIKACALFSGGLLIWVLNASGLESSDTRVGTDIPRVGGHVTRRDTAGQ